MNKARPAALLVATLAMAACGVGDSEQSLEDDSAVVFHFKMKGHSKAEDFRAVISDPYHKALARAELRLPKAERRLHVRGTIASTNGGYNLKWNWHFVGAVSLAQFSMEDCDTAPSLIESDVAYWVNAPSGACPWGSYVYAEFPPRPIH